VPLCSLQKLGDHRAP